MEETHLCQKSSGKEFCQQVFITAGLRLILDLIYLSYIFPKSPVNDQELILGGDKSDHHDIWCPLGISQGILIPRNKTGSCPAACYGWLRTHTPK